MTLWWTPRRAKFDAAHKAEEVAAKAEGEIDPEHEVTVIKATSLPIASDFGIDPNLYPESTIVPGKSAKTSETVNKFDYKCKVCHAHSSQNHPSMCTHTCKCLNIKIGCPLCDAKYDSSDYLEGHIIKTHGGSLKLEDQKAAEKVVAGLASTSMQIE